MGPYSISGSAARKCRAGQKKQGEATPHYLHNAKAPPRIRHYAPKAHIVVILRSPAARAHSDFVKAVGARRETRNFDQALLAATNSLNLPAMLAGSFVPMRSNGTDNALSRSKCNICKLKISLQMPTGQ